MRFALTNLDNGLFFAKGGWTSDGGLAQIFADTETVAHVASENNIKNAAAAMIGGDPPHPRGFLWLTKPARNPCVGDDRAPQ
jgi:hypothetical protein